MKRDLSDTQIIFLATKKEKKGIKNKCKSLGITTRSGDSCMSDLIRMSVKHCVNNYERVFIDSIKESSLATPFTYCLVIKTAGDEVIDLWPGDSRCDPPIERELWSSYGNKGDKKIIMDPSLVGRNAIVDFVDEYKAILIDVLD